jgi:hypothetical protein
MFLFSKNAIPPYSPLRQGRDEGVTLKQREIKRDYPSVRGVKDGLGVI